MRPMACLVIINTSQPNWSGNESVKTTENWLAVGSRYVCTYMYVLLTQYIHTIGSQMRLIEY